MNVNHLLDPESGGGTAERTFQLSLFLSRRLVQTTILTLDIGLTAERRTALQGVNLVALPCINRRYFVPKMWTGEADRLVAEADIVHLSGHWTLLNALIYKSCKRLGKPFVFCPAGALLPFGRSLALKRTYDILIGREIARSAAACIAITDKERDELAAYGVEQRKISVIPNGIDPQLYAAADNYDIEKEFRSLSGLGGAPFVLFLGRLNAIKGPDLLLEAFARVSGQFPELHLVFAGPDGGMESQLRATTDQKALKDKVHFTGYLRGDKKAAVLRAAKLLAIPSRQEAMSIVVLEAGICGTPVLFTTTCGLEELAKKGAGKMVNPSVEGLAGGLSGLLSDETATAQAATRLENLIRANFLWEHQAERYCKLYEHILSGTSP